MKQRYSTILNVAFVAILAALLPIISTAQNVLILFDDAANNTNTVALKNALDNAGYPTTISSVNESSWNGTNPALTNFDVVVHLNGTTYSSEMPTAGQNALVDFVENDGGLYVQFEWHAYQYDQNNQMQSMVDLILFQRTSGTTATATITEVSAQSGHPVLATVPASFSLTGGFNVGNLRSFSSDPSLVLMKEGTNDAVAIREFGEGCVLGFHNAGNYSGYSILSDSNVHHLIIDFIGYCGFCGVTVVTDDTAVSCFGYNDGAASVSVSGGVPPYSYEWNTGDTSSSISNLTAGVYNVTVLDQAGCQTVKNITVGSPGAIYTDIQMNNFVTCYGAMNGSAEVFVTGGTPPFSYLWNNGDTSSATNTLPGGDAVVLVTDSNGCVFADTVFIGEPEAIVADYNITTVDCDGDLGGAITANVSGGIPPYYYLWSTGSTFYNLSNLTNGVYHLTITDNVNCIVQDSAVLPHNFLTPTVDLGPDQDICIDWPIKLNAGNPGETFMWSTGSSAQSITVGYAATIWVAVTNENGCVGRDTVVITTHTCLGIKEFDEQSTLSLFPNPSDGLVYVLSADQSIVNADVEVYDLSGKIVLHKNIDQISPKTPALLDLSQLSTGSYLVKISNGSHESRLRIMISK